MFIKFLFLRPVLKNIEAMLDAVFTYFGFEQNIMIEILSNNLQVISNSNLDLFGRKTTWLENFLERGEAQ